MATKNTILGTVPKSRGRYTEGDTTTKWYYDNILEYKGSSFRCINETSTGITGAPATYNANTHTLVPNAGWEFFVDTTGALDVGERLTKNENKLSELEIEVIYDVTANNNGATFVSLSALLSSENLSTIIPTSVRHGGISIRFAQSSDNKYVQYFLTKNEWSTNEADWEKMNLEEEVSQLYQEVNGNNNSQDFYFSIAIGSVDYTKTVEVKAGKYNITVDDTNNVLPQNTIIYLDGTRIGYLKSLTNPVTISSDVTTIRMYASEQAANSGDITIHFEDTEFKKSLSSKIEDVGTKYDEVVTELDNRYNAYVGSIKHVQFATSAGKDVSTKDKKRVSITANTNFSITCDSLSVLSTNSVAIYFLYADGTTYQTNIAKNQTRDFTANKDIISLYCFVTSLNVISDGSFELAIEVHGSKIQEIDETLHKVEQEVVKLTYVGITSSAYNNWEVGDLYLNVDAKIIKKVVSVSPRIDFIPTNILDLGILYLYEDRLYTWDGYKLVPTFEDGVDSIMDYTPIFQSERFEIGANKNNDGDEKYIYKEILLEIESNELLVIECNSITGNITHFPIRVKANKDGSVVYLESYSDSYFNGRQKKMILAIDKSYTNVVVILYASTSGGLTDTYTVYEGLEIYKSKSGSKDFGEDYVAHDSNTIPAYYLANNYLKNKIDTIRQLMRSANGNYDAFIFDTDQHWKFNTRNSPSVINYLTKHVTINRMFMGGDLADGINMDGYSAFRDAFNGRIYYVAGNHEYMDYFEEENIQKQQEIIDSDIWAYYQSHMDDAVIGDANNNYYYVDNTVQKMRYVIIKVFTDNSASIFTDTQRDWLRDVALNVPSGYSIVIFTHHFRSHTETVNPQVGGKITDVIDNYTGNGTIVSVIQGHTHYDFVWQTAGGNNVVATTCDKNEGREDWGDAYLEDDRIEGTITEIAFDVVVVDKTHKKATFVRIGAPAYNDDGQTRDASKDLEERAVVYEKQNVAINGTITLTPGITGTWTSSDDNIASVSDGVVTGVAKGIAIIAVIDSTNHRAVWHTVEVS